MSDKSLADLTRALMDSTCVHVMSRMYSSKNRAAYLKSMIRCYYICSEAESGNNLRLMRAKLVKLRREAPRTFISRFELFSSVKESYLTGIDHSIDVVESILTRFVDGYANAPEFFVKSVLERLNDGREV